MIEDQGALFDVDAPAAPATSKKQRARPAESRDDMCLCGCSRDHHADGRGVCLRGMGTRFFDAIERKYKSGQCECKRFRSKKRAPVRAPVAIVRPAAALDWYRGPPEIVTRKLGGWYLLGPTSFLGYIANTKIKSYNAVLKAASQLAAFRGEKLAQRLVAGAANARKAFGYRATAMLEQARVAERGPCRSAKIVRVGSPRLRDDDNMIPSCKEIRDAIAETLGFDDSRFQINAALEPNKIPIYLEQTTAGARKAYAVLIELAW